MLVPILAAAVTVVVVASATVALCLGHIDGEAYLGFIGTLVGGGVGAGIHAAGVKSAGVAPPGA